MNAPYGQPRSQSSRTASNSCRLKNESHYSESYLTINCRSVLVSGAHLGPTTRFLMLSDSCGFVDAERPLWREVGSVVYSCCWASPAQYSRVRVPLDWWPYFTVSNFILLQPGLLGPHIYISQKQGGPVMPPGTGLLTRAYWIVPKRLSCWST
jgi:hypothetical protein